MVISHRSVEHCDRLIGARRLVSMSSSFDKIPTIDLSLVDNPETTPQLLDSLHYALTEVGFLYVSNHGVPIDVIASLVQALPTLFSQPADVKKCVAMENSPHFLGYSSVGSETTAGVSDRREQFEFATELTEVWREGLPLYERLRGPNQARSLPPETFKSFLSDQHRLKLVRYPGLPPEDLDASKQGVGPHKDSSGWWTFLLQASPPEVKGLQALNKAGEWIDVPNVPGTFVVNIGQAFEVVTNGTCKATTHRVLSSSRERFSVPFFQGVRRDLTKIEAVETLKAHFESLSPGQESTEGHSIDSAFLRGKYDTWGESQLRTKVRSHRENGRKFYAQVYDRYISDDV
ncbi:hypothetical protein SLS62_011205 [Diatrype stigma]|uniref:Fe2OG dioxygenase domain-containing protein n=1 Tax=Diatrype stigma TaxID=117547 RepID=A0AAN9UDC8_9PEZI